MFSIFQPDHEPSTLQLPISELSLYYFSKNVLLIHSFSRQVYSEALTEFDKWFEAFKEADHLIQYRQSISRNQLTIG